MKFIDVCGERKRLPNETEICEIIMRLPSPVHVMAWLMAETGCRLNVLRDLRVSNYHERAGTMSIGTESGGLKVTLSRGLRDAVDDYLFQLREKFERRKWPETITIRNAHLVHKFQDQRLFPAWSMHGFERSELGAVFDGDVFASELSRAAVSSGFTGMIHSNTLRLFCAQRWIKEGASLETIHQRLGHRDVMTTMLMVQALRNGGLTFTRVHEEAGHRDSAACAA